MLSRVGFEGKLSLDILPGGFSTWKCSGCGTNSDQTCLPGAVRACGLSCQARSSCTLPRTWWACRVDANAALGSLGGRAEVWSLGVAAFQSMKQPLFGKSEARGVFLPPLVRKWPTPSKRNPSLRGESINIVHKRWQTDPLKPAAVPTCGASFELLRAVSSEDTLKNCVRGLGAW